MYRFVTLCLFLKLPLSSTEGPRGNIAPQGELCAVTTTADGRILRLAEKYVTGRISIEFEIQTGEKRERRQRRKPQSLLECQDGNSIFKELQSKNQKRTHFTPSKDRKRSGGEGRGYKTVHTVIAVRSQIRLQYAQHGETLSTTLSTLLLGSSWS